MTDEHVSDSSQPPVPVATAQEPITLAGRRIFAAQFAKLRACESGVRAGDDAEAVHDMRVASRRMRSAFRLLGAYYPPETLRGVRKPLRELAQSLGEMRDLDVMIENAQAYADGLSPERRQVFEPMLAAWQVRRAQAHQTAMDFLNSPRFEKWLSAFERFLESAPAEMLAAPRVCDVAPLLVWEHYQAVRRYATRLPDAPIATFHELRIECKRLRYTLEFFADWMGAQTPRLIKTLVGAQDLLGYLHDADVARQQVTAFMTAQMQADGAPDAKMLKETTAYLHFLQRRIGSLQRQFARRWQRLIAPSFRRSLARAVAVM